MSREEREVRRRRVGERESWRLGAGVASSNMADWRSGEDVMTMERRFEVESPRPSLEDWMEEECCERREPEVEVAGGTA